MRKNTEAEFRGKVEITDGCWNWKGGKSPSGYGIYYNGKACRAHRFSFILHGGVIPEGHELDHTCRNRACVNPAHLEAVTHSENVRRSRRDHCLKGHPKEVGGPPCEICRKESRKRWLKKNRKKYNDSIRRWYNENKEHRRAYLREYMRRRRAALKSGASQST